MTASTAPTIDEAADVALDAESVARTVFISAWHAVEQAERDLVDVDGFQHLTDHEKAVLSKVNAARVGWLRDDAARALGLWLFVRVEMTRRFGDLHRHRIVRLEVDA